MTREERKKWYYEQTHKVIDNISYKQCSKHSTYFPEEDSWFPDTNEYFYLRNKKKPELGLSAECIKCTIQYGLNYVKINRLKHNKYKKKVYDTNQFNVQERVKIHNLKRRLSGKERDWRRNNPDKDKINSLRHRKHDVNKNEWRNCKLYFGNKCACCGLDISEHFYTRNGITKQGDFHKDHLYHDGKNNLSNCIPLCNTCNTEKHTKTINQYYNPNNPNYTFERYHKIYLWIRYDYKKYIEKKKPKQKYNRKKK